MAKLRWVRVQREDDDSDIVTYRAAVPGGWLVSVWAQCTKEDGEGKDVPEGTNWGGGLTFLPDPDHKAWDVEVHGPTPAK